MRRKGKPNSTAGVLCMVLLAAIVADRWWFLGERHVRVGPSLAGDVKPAVIEPETVAVLASRESPRREPKASAAVRTGAGTTLEQAAPRALRHVAVVPTSASISGRSQEEKGVPARSWNLE